MPRRSEARFIRTAPDSISFERGLMSAQTPIVSVVMPCRNEIHGIEATMASVLDQEAPEGDFEIIVVDGMSDDGTREVLDRVAGLDARVRVVDNPERITPCAMNAGIGVARGRYIAIMGAHNRYAPDYLTRCLELAERTGADNVGGAVFAEAAGYLERAVAASHHSWFSVGGSHWHDSLREGPAESVWGGFYRREVFDRIGLFDESLVRNQDDELNLRLVRAGGVIWQSPTIRSWYQARGSLRALFKQYRQYGYWKVRVIRKHRLPASARHLVPAGFLALVITQLLAAVALQLLAIGNPRLAAPALVVSLSLIGVLVAYAAAGFVAAVTTATAQGWDLLPVLPVVFPLYHLGYGLGFIAGLRDAALARRAPNWAGELTR